MVDLASGTRASLRFTRETNGADGTKGTTPPAVLATQALADGTGISLGAGTGEEARVAFKLDSGTPESVGIVPGQTITVAGATAAANNGDWKVHSTNSTSIICYDTADVAVVQDDASSVTVIIKLTDLRTTGRNINLEKDLLESAEVDADGMETDVRHGFNRVTGSPGYQLSTIDYDDMLELAFGNSWTDVDYAAESTTVVTTPTTITTAGATPLDNGLRIGDRVTLSGGAAPANDKDVIITAIAGDVITVVNPDGTAAALSGTGAIDVFYNGARLDMGTGVDTFLMERAFLDIGKYQLFNGCAVDGMDMSVSTESMVTGSFNLIGMSAAAIAASSVSTLTPVVGSGNTPYAAFDGAIFENGEVNAVITAFDFTVTRNRSTVPVVGSKFSPDVFEGTAMIEGTLSAYFESDTMFNKFVNETESTIVISLVDPSSSSNFFTLTFPRIKYNGANMDPPQQGPIVQDMPFKALKATGLANAMSTATPLINTSMSIQRGNRFDT
jgi:hypothetical protein